MKKSALFKWFFLLLSVIAISRFCHHQTKGFALYKIRDNLPLDTTFEYGHIDHSFFEQKFYFLSRGKQSFVFVSEDGQHVIKLFDNKHQRYPLSFFQDTEKARKAFKSYALAFNEMQNQTALVYVHAKKTSTLPAKLSIMDKLNIEHILNPNEVAFLVQKRVQPAYPTLLQFIQEKRWEEAKAAIASLVQIFIWKHQHEIADSDPLIRTNYGFLGTQAIQIDLGSLYKKVVTKEIFALELKRITDSLRDFLTHEAPELVTTLEEELEKSLSSF
ncbi:MAG: hypothetical protein RLZZ453_285 [Chlamydiota bacterium]|jgi:hypothetical protein